MKINDVAQRTGLTAHTLRYYEKIGLLPPVDRDPSGQRAYNSTHLSWIEFILRLKASGMSMGDIAAYTRMWREGDSARCDLLEQHRARLQEKIQTLNHCVDLLDAKIAKLKRGE